MEADVLARVDPQSGAVAARYQVGALPRDLATGGGAAWTANEEGELDRVDLTTGEARRSRFGRPAPGQAGAKPLQPIALDLEAGAGTLWILARQPRAAGAGATAFDDQLVRVDARSGRTLGVAQITRGRALANPVLAVAPGTLWVFDGARLLRLDAAGRGRPEAVALGDDATDLAASASSLWTLERRRGAAVRRDLRSGRALGRLNGVGRLTPGVERVELVPADGRMLIVRIRRRSVTAIDAGSGRRCTIETGVAPVAIAAGEGRLVVAARDGTLTRAPLDDCGGV